MNNTKNIPLPTSLPEERHHKDIESCSLIFDTETTGLSDDCDIVQVLGVDYILSRFKRSSI